MLSIRSARSIHSSCVLASSCSCCKLRINRDRELKFDKILLTIFKNWFTVIIPVSSAIACQENHERERDSKHLLYEQTSSTSQYEFQIGLSQKSDFIYCCCQLFLGTHQRQLFPQGLCCKYRFEGLKCSLLEKGKVPNNENRSSESFERRQIDATC